MLPDHAGPVTVYAPLGGDHVGPLISLVEVQWDILIPMKQEEEPGIILMNALILIGETIPVPEDRNNVRLPIRSMAMVLAASLLICHEIFVGGIQEEVLWLSQFERPIVEIEGVP